MRTLLLTALFLVPTASFAAPFFDVPDTHANADAIAYVKAQGIVEGYADGTYKPDATINRAEFVKILGTTLGFVPRENESCFTDFRPRTTEWYYGYACGAKREGIIDGYPDGTFRAMQKVNFVEAAKILANAYGISASTTIPACEERSCPWYREYVLMLEMRNAIPVSITGLDQAITRGEMAEMIYRLQSGNADAPSRTYKMLELRTETVTKGDVSFEITYPGWWGVLQHEDQDEQEGFYSWTFDALYATPYSAYVIVTPKLGGMQFLSKPCTEMGCTNDLTFDQARARFESNRTSAGGMRIYQRDSYSAESGSFGRHGSFYTDSGQVSMGAWTGVKLYDDEYYRRQDRGESPSISELVYEDIGDSKDPINVVFAKYPTETVAEQRFFAQVDAMIGSVR